MNIPYVILATNNKHKQQEFQHALNTEILTPNDLGILDFDPIECGETFEANAMIKAEALYHILQTHANIPQHYIVIADDSGLCVEALQGLPGIFSARYAHMQNGNTKCGNSSDADNREALKAALKEHGIWGSKAYFQCSIAYIIHDEAKQKNIQNVVSGQCHGIVAIKESGTHGFGYDSMFYRDFSQDEILMLDFTLPTNNTNNKITTLESLQHSLATLPLEEKTKISHRGQAIQSLLKVFLACFR
ncbi:non-canonical purine NTP pyrophosphatase [Helicobacter bilis]|uniref:non-canonical purine NTP pyrophosphatase n=1 Tax=Helicobacter bilis TaxID=37372 RepID=UPI000CF12BD3|nr:non-canonical purine NTP pyrophosphatase [Helicobacter bilis]